MYEILFGWPDELSQPFSNEPFLESARLYRLQSFLGSESLLLAHLTLSPENIDGLFLLALMRLRQRSYHAFNDVYEKLIGLLVSDNGLTRFLFSQYSLQTISNSAFPSFTSDFWSSVEHYPPLKLSHVAYLLHLKQFSNAENLLDTCSDFLLSSLEAIRLRCRLFECRNDYTSSLKLLSSIVNRFPQHLPLRIHHLDSAIKARSQDQTIPILNALLAHFSSPPELLTLLSQIRLLQECAGDARILILRNRVWNTIHPNSETRESNIYNCYDRLGQVDWLAFSPFFIDPKTSSLSFAVKENLCMQSASLQMPQYASAVNSILCEYTRLNSLSPELSSNHFHNSSLPIPSSKLTIAWLSSDISYHPVGRFLYGLLNRLTSPYHRHILIDLQDHGGESRREWFDSIASLDVLTSDHSDFSSKVSLVRSVEADIAVDLSGWTSGHFLRGFLCGLAPIQLTYLGYFASTGLSNMDYWLGDCNLFPDPMNEWHQETLWRLPRCFIAWDPPPSLPEASVHVVDSFHTSNVGIRFGSFNHHRKLSDQTLKLWGQVLEMIPGSSLVLKSGRSSDTYTSSLLSSRMRSAGLDPSKVTWIPRANSIVEHLQQYSYIDIALDSFPNGGCTTTCEALWMGVPVITLAGKSYVSRMSHAVLYGAGLTDWSVNEYDEYLNLAISYADKLSWLRQNRDYWRKQILSNPLGNASDLISKLELSFSQMVASQ